MASWKKVVVSGSNISQLNNNSNYIANGQSGVSLTGSFTGSFVGDGSGLTGIVTGSGTLNFSGSTGNGSVNLSTQTFSVLGTTNQITTVGSGQNVTISLPSSIITPGSLTVTGDLTVNGTTTSVSSSNLLVADKFVLFASGSTTDTDGGFIVQKNASGQGYALGYDTTTTRWVLDADLAYNATDIVADAYVGVVQVGTAVPVSAPTYGGASNGFGTIYVDTDDGDIYIYA